MKKALLIILVSSVAFIAGCKKEQDTTGPGTATFYTSSKGNWMLILDGKEQKTLPYAASAPQCGDTIFIVKQLSPGTHTISAKNIFGTAKGPDIQIKTGECIVINIPQ